MSKSKEFCSVDDLSVLIPYKTLDNLLQIARKCGDYEQQMKRMDERLGALWGLYTEVLDVVKDIRENL